jgi:hypothetical protein
MKNLMFILMFCMACGGTVVPSENTSTGNIVDTEVTGQVDTEEASGAGSDCEKACHGFEFTECLSVLMKVLPVGQALYTATCLERCDEFVVIYKEISEEVPFKCLGTAASCPAVAECFEVKE